MLNQQLSKDTDFIVRESVRTDYLISIFFFLLFILVVYNMVYNYDPLAPNRIGTVLLLTIVPAISFLMKGIKNQIALTINRTGIYYKKTLLTNWQNFINAYITQDKITGSYADNFVLILEYYKDGEEGFFKRKLPLTNTQNKTEEEIIAAIRFYSGVNESV